MTSQFIEPCLPTISRMVPTGPGWAYEIKHDGFRFLAVRQGNRVLVFSRGGHDWSKQLPAIIDAMQALPVRSVVLDGEGVICGPDGKSDFDAMRACFSRNGAPEAFLYAVDLLELDGRELRNEPWARGPRFTGAAPRRVAAWDPPVRAHRGRRRRGGVPAGVRDGSGRHRRQAARQPLPLGTLPGMDQSQEQGSPGDRAGDGDRLEQTSPALIGAGGVNSLYPSLGDNYHTALGDDYHYSWKAFATNLRDVRRRGHHMSEVGELMTGIFSIAVPIFSGDQKIIGSLTVLQRESGRSSRIDQLRLAAVRKAASDLSKAYSAIESSLTPDVRLPRQRLARGVAQPL
jgi:ATP dependent DNA ligase domain/Bacterial transcriptional regulator